MCGQFAVREGGAACFARARVARMNSDAPAAVVPTNGFVQQDQCYARCRAMHGQRLLGAAAGGGERLGSGRAALGGSGMGSPWSFR